MKKSLLLSLSLWSLSLPVIAKPYLVIFNYQEKTLMDEEHSSLSKIYTASPKNHDFIKAQIEKNLRQTNKKYIDYLTRKNLKKIDGSPTVVKDLWAARSALIDVSDEVAGDLRREPWVHRLIEDRRRQFITPRRQLKITDTLKELTNEQGRLWGLEQTGLYALREQKPELRGKGVRVGILDTGLQAKHPEFKDLPVKPLFKDFVARLVNPYDDHGHGTHVAGTIAGVQTGFAPEVQLVIAKVFGADGSGVDSEIIEAMQWMTDPDQNPDTPDQPHLVNNSWGADLTGDGPFDIEQVSHFRNAINTWIALGIVPVFAAGNSGSFPNGIPGGLPEAFAVGAINSDLQVTDFSSQGPNMWVIKNRVITLLKPDISAPGQDIVSAFPGNKYAQWSGTSMATPHVSGALSLFFQNYMNELSDSPVQVAKSALVLSSERKVSVTYGFGTLNLLNLLNPGTQKNDSAKTSPKLSKPRPAVIF
jgi:subtilisin family serine protease